MSKKKVLIITYYWPPSGGSGVQRWVKFCKYLPDFGWSPIVYTPSNPERPAIDHSLLHDIPNEVSVIKQPIWEPYQLYKKFVGLKKDEKLGSALMKSGNERSIFHDISVWIRGNLFIPDARKFWIAPSVRFLTNYISSNPVDVIVSTGPPHSLHLIAQHVSEKTGTPWLADFRDPWTNIDFFEDLNLSSFARRKHHRLEKNVLTAADKLTVVSNTMKMEFSEITDTEISVIPNGFDAEDFPDFDYKPNEFCTISHVGMMTPTRNPQIIWEALRELADENTEFNQRFRLQLIGKVDASIIELVHQKKLSHLVQFKEYVPHDQIINVEQSSEALLLIINNTPNAALLLTGKLFEYLAAKRPIVCITPVHGDASELLRESSNSSSIHLYNDKQGLKEQFETIFDAWKNGKDLYTNSHADQYSRKNLTGTMAQNLRSLL